MQSTTITEALANLKTLEKRVAKKKEFVGSFLVRQEKFKDPLADKGGSRQAIAQERQAIADLENFALATRVAINDANRTTMLTLGSETMSVAQWLVWRREVAPKRQQFLNAITAAIKDVRQKATKSGVKVLSGENDSASQEDVIVNLDERTLASEIEAMETMLGDLDGKLSLLNATTVVAIG